ncbi:PAS domain-containing protein [Kordiimonas sediminis]|nr:PAS domain-containing protein [Kordiimonas sediminis]
MIDHIENLQTSTADLTASFHRSLYSHWVQIADDNKFPDKKDFRPQLFSSFLPQVALITIDKNGYRDRLTGSAILERFRLSNQPNALSDSPDQAIRGIIRQIVDASLQTQAPLFMRGSVISDKLLPVAFTLVCLPLTVDGTDSLDTLLLAFEFPKQNSFDAFAIDSILQPSYM